MGGAFDPAEMAAAGAAAPQQGEEEEEEEEDELNVHSAASEGALLLCTNSPHPACKQQGFQQMLHRQC